jgi:hypothetical protein
MGPVRRKWCMTRHLEPRELKTRSNHIIISTHDRQHMRITHSLLKILVHADAEITCGSLADGILRVWSTAFVINFPHVLAGIHSVSRRGCHDDAAMPSPVFRRLGRVDQDGIGKLSGKLSNVFDGGVHVVVFLVSFEIYESRGLSAEFRSFLVSVPRDRNDIKRRKEFCYSSTFIHSRRVVTHYAYIIERWGVRILFCEHQE